MLRTTMMTSSAIVALLAVAACGQQTDQAKQEQAKQETQQQQAEEIAAQPAPTVADRTAAEAGNEIEQVASPTTQFTPKELADGLNGEAVPSPATALATAAVKTSSGEALGEVRSVVVGPNGKASAVIVEVGGFLNVGERGVSIEAKRFTYLKDRNILVVAIDKTDVEKLPTVPPA